jgi:hypothetical protein
LSKATFSKGIGTRTSIRTSSGTRKLGTLSRTRRLLLGLFRTKKLLSSLRIPVPKSKRMSKVLSTLRTSITPRIRTQTSRALRIRPVVSRTSRVRQSRLRLFNVDTTVILRVLIRYTY